jgi:hypothetical protein
MGAASVLSPVWAGEASLLRWLPGLPLPGYRGCLLLHQHLVLLGLLVMLLLVRQQQLQQQQLLHCPEPREPG